MTDAETFFRLTVQLEYNVEEKLICAPNARAPFLEAMAQFLCDCLLMKKTGVVGSISPLSECNLRGFVEGKHHDLVISGKQMQITIERQNGWGIHVSDIIIMPQHLH